MREVDDFSRRLLEEAKRFYEKAQQEDSSEGKSAYLHAALVLGFSALEAHVNSIADDFLTRKDLSLLERSVLAERDIKLEKGQFKVTKQLKIYRLEDRIEFLYRKYSGEPIDKSSGWWAELKTGLRLRNGLVHPKEAPDITEATVENALNAIIDTLSALYNAVYKTKYPLALRGLDSKLEF